MSSARRISHRRRLRRRRVLGLAALLVALALGWVAYVQIAGLNKAGPAAGSAPGSSSTSTAASTVSTSAHPVHVTDLVERRASSLPAPLQDPAPVGVGRRVILLGGLTAADTSSDGILLAGSGGARQIGTLPSARHDTAAAAIGRYAYLFGGGDGVQQLDQIVRIDPRSGATAVVGTLPAPSSDSAAAAIGGTAYIVGGYTGSAWLDTIVAWRPGSSSRIVAHLPAPVRYAAVTAAAGRLVIAGGSLEDGSASDAVYEYVPSQRRVRLVGRLPEPTTHAAAASLGSFAFVIGGRGANLGSVTSRIVSIAIRTGKIRRAGALAVARSDLAAAAIGNAILVAGGNTGSATVGTITTLVPVVRTLAGGSSGGSAHGSTHGAAVSVYAHDGAGMLTPVTRLALSRVYVPNSQNGTVDVIDPRTYRVVEHFDVGALPQHVVPAWDLKTLYVTNDAGNSLTPINPDTGKPGRPIPVDDPYNLYFTPDGTRAVVVAERLHRLDFRDPHTFRLEHSLDVPCVGVDHIDFSADGSYLIASCEFSGQVIKVDVAAERVVGVLTLPDGGSGMPQDVKLSPDGRVFYVADQSANGVWEVNGAAMRVTGFIATGEGAHGLYPSRDSRFLYVSNRTAGSISVISFRTRKVIRTWRIPGGGSPDMGGVSVDGKVLWLSGRYNGVVYAISTLDGHLIAKVPVGPGPHGVCVWPQPGRYSLGHTGILR